MPVTQEKTVAIIGSGPSGLAAALDLMIQGYKVTMYEKEEKPGGALYSGVPSYRLPREVLHGEIYDLVALGLDLRCGIEIGREVPLDHLIGEYDAVLIAVGLHESRILPLPGHEADGVRGALDFLKAANWKGDAGVKGKRVLVIGGGNVAVDVARCAIRTGATEVRLACLEGDQEMPCHPWEIEEALDEGVIAMCSLGPEEVLERDGKVVGMKMRECISVFDESGRFAPVFGENYSEFEVDVVVFAVGQFSRLGSIVAGTDIVLTERGLLPVDGTLFTTDHPGVFACGEVVTGPGSAIGSIATGHEAATSVHRYLQGESVSADRTPRPVPVYPKYQVATLEGVEEARTRIEMPMARGEDRAKDFRQVELGMTHLEGLQEAARCLRCQSEVCVGCTFCARTCPDYAIQVERVDDPGQRRLARYELDLSKCSSVPSSVRPTLSVTPSSTSCRSIIAISCFSTPMRCCALPSPPGPRVLMATTLSRMKGGSRDAFRTDSVLVAYGGIIRRCGDGRVRQGCDQDGGRTRRVPALRGRLVPLLQSDVPRHRAGVRLRGWRTRAHPVRDHARASIRRR